MHDCLQRRRRAYAIKALINFQDEIVSYCYFSGNGLIIGICKFCDLVIIILISDLERYCLCIKKAIFKIEEKK